MWVTVLVSQPSVSIDTETTQRICSPSRPGRADGVHHFAQEFAFASFALRFAGAVAGALARA